MPRTYLTGEELLSEETKAILQRARDTYGFKNQISVAYEELNELAAVLSKYTRYDSHEAAVNALTERVIDECADVFNGLNHVLHIFGINTEVVSERAAVKMERVERWMNTTSSLQISTVDRDIAPNVMGYSLNHTPSEISNKLRKLCNGCSGENCKDAATECSNYEQRQLLESELDRALSRA